MRVYSTGQRRNRQTTSSLLSSVFKVTEQSICDIVKCGNTHEYICVAATQAAKTEKKLKIGGKMLFSHNTELEN